MPKPKQRCVLHYRRRAKRLYEVTVPYSAFTGIEGSMVCVPVFGCSAGECWIKLCLDGTLIVRDGYQWNGASGPTLHTKSTMRPSLEHDAFYQLMREGKLDRKYRKKVDQLYRRRLRVDGVSLARASWHYAAVRAFGRKHTFPRKPYKRLCAP